MLRQFAQSLQPRQDNQKRARQQDHEEYPERDVLGERLGKDVLVHVCICGMDAFSIPKFGIIDNSLF